MNRRRLEEILGAYKAGEITVSAVVDSLRQASIADLGFAQVDLDRSRRRGVPEVIFGQGKTPEHIAEIMAALWTNGQRAVATRVPPEAAETILARLVDLPLVYDATARCLYTESEIQDDGAGTILVVCAGTSDLPVAAEAALTARLCGNRVETLTDVGVAGLHRLLGHLDLLRSANVVIVCAGMEGALPSVVAGLVARPIVAVPTSIGYGASFEGVTALLSMMNSCAAGVTVVNIDNGFGAGYAASVINRRLPTP
jgi:pyridinium-3,5-biscarboxylic acid mononucleotide synthase